MKTGSALSVRKYSVLCGVGLLLVPLVLMAVLIPPAQPATPPPVREAALPLNDLLDPSKVYGKIQFVDSFPDYKVKVVTSFPDLRVQIVEHFPDKPGKWQIVDHFPDYKIQIVDNFPDFTIQYVNHFPGVP